MKNMSFFRTQEQILNRTKTVTRRRGWKSLKPGEHFMAVVKTMGLGKGGKMEAIAELICVSNRTIRVTAITRADVRREGFGEMNALEFIEMFCSHIRVAPKDKVQRIEFEYAESGKS
jgi:hypothetical protein